MARRSRFAADRLLRRAHLSTRRSGQLCRFAASAGRVHRESRRRRIFDSQAPGVWRIRHGPRWLQRLFGSGARLFASLADAWPPASVHDAGHHLIPRQFAFAGDENDRAVQPQINYQPDQTILYRFWPNTVVRGRFEKLGGGYGYIWGAGAGYFEYVVPVRNDHRRVGQIVVRAHIQPVLPVDAKPEWIRTRVTLFVNGTDCGSRLIPVEDPKAPLI